MINIKFMYPVLTKMHCCSSASNKPNDKLWEIWLFETSFPSIKRVLYEYGLVSFNILNLTGYEAIFSPYFAKLFKNWF